MKVIMKVAARGLARRRNLNRARRLGNWSIRKASNQGSGAIVAVVVANEWKQVGEEFLEYYRNLGVEHFIVLSRTAQAFEGNDVTDFQVPENIAFIDALNGVSASLCDGSWVLFLCAGEYVVYPFMDTRNLHELAGHLEDDRRSVMHAVTVDVSGDSEVAFAQGSGVVYFQSYGYYQTLDDKGRLSVYRGVDRENTSQRLPEKERLNGPVFCKWKAHYAFSVFRGRVWPPHLNEAHKLHNVSVSGVVLRHPPDRDVGGTGAFPGELGMENIQLEPLSRDRARLAGLFTKYDGWRQLFDLGFLHPGRWV